METYFASARDMTYMGCPSVGFSVYPCTTATNCVWSGDSYRWEDTKRVYQQNKSLSE